MAEGRREAAVLQSPAGSARCGMGGSVSSMSCTGSTCASSSDRLVQEVADSASEPRPKACCRSRCVYCGADVGLLFNLDGFGFARRRHERRCLSLKEAAAATDNVLEGQQAAAGGLQASLLSGASGGSLVDHRTSLDVPGRGTASFAPGLASASWPSCPKRRRREARAQADLVSRSVAEVEDEPEEIEGRRLFPTGSARSAAAMAAAAAAVCLEAPAIAAGLVAATVALRLSGLRRQTSDLGSSALSSTVGDNSSASSAIGSLAGVPGASVSSTGLECSATALDPQLHAEALRLIDEFHIRDALRLVEEKCPPAGEHASEPEEIRWLRRLAPLAADALRETKVPQQGDPNWTGPLECEGDTWHMALWYRWVSSTTIVTITTLRVRASFQEAAAVFHEADTVDKWIPFVNHAEAAWSPTMPAMNLCMKAKIPILPGSVSSTTHRVIMDAFDDRPGVLLVEWSPTSEEKASGFYAGAPVPSCPARASEVQVRLSSTLVQQDDKDHCTILMRGENDFKVNRRLVPDAVLRKFLRVNTRVMAQRISTCLEEGYAPRLQADSHGFYRRLGARCAGSS
eukprot:TRINITY_DN51013_c0_g1_i1.p1 TRINITY_DN51013_c0_g1~~TRINITY_DN51013_c0_g1_i1.p1  ORF type:complete len:572 (-),score=71.47 TRINITY_DN51013_c0_g1_i1:281-1996(-)